MRALQDEEGPSEPVQLDLLDWLAAQGAASVDSGSASLSAPTTSSPAPEPVPPSMSLRLTRVNLSCNMRRFYSVAVIQSLWGKPGVVRHWGRIGRPGQQGTDWHETAQEAERASEDVLRAKRRRGYEGAPLPWRGGSD